VIDQPKSARSIADADALVTTDVILGVFGEEDAVAATVEAHVGKVASLTRVAKKAAKREP
jgi:hypothetical protein